jgi:hypothetical protein
MDQCYLQSFGRLCEWSGASKAFNIYLLLRNTTCLRPVRSRNRGTRASERVDLEVCFSGPFEGGWAGSILECSIIRNFLKINIYLSNHAWQYGSCGGHHHGVCVQGGGGLVLPALLSSCETQLRVSVVDRVRGLMSQPGCLMKSILGRITGLKAANITSSLPLSAQDAVPFWLAQPSPASHPSAVIRTMSVKLSHSCRCYKSTPAPSCSLNCAPVQTNNETLNSMLLTL